jgi:hypothetical protein
MDRETRLLRGPNGRFRTVLHLARRFEQLSEVDRFSDHDERRPGA